MRGTVEGRHAVIEALRSGAPVRSVTIAEGTRPDRSLDLIRELAAQAGVPVLSGRRADLDRLSERGAHQGVVAELEPFRYAGLEEVVATAEGRERSLIVALDHITDPGNLGAVIRSAEVAGADGVVVPSRRSAQVGPAVYKTSAGAVAHLPVARVVNLPRALATLKEAGYWVVGASEKTGRPVWEESLPDRMVLVMGAEDAGLSRLVAETCDLLVGLPVAGRVGSLNVAQAATVLMFEWVRGGRA